MADRGRCEGPRLKKMLKSAQISLENVTFLDKCQHESGDFDSAIEMNSGKQPPGTHCHHFTNMSDINSTC